MYRMRDPEVPDHQELPPVRSFLSRGNAVSRLSLRIALTGLALLPPLGCAGCGNSDPVAPGSVLALAQEHDESGAIEALQRDGHPDAVDTAGRSALHHAARASMDELAAALLHAGATVDLKAKDGRTPLIEAADAGSLPIVELLIDAGARRGTKDASGSDAAFYAEAKMHMVQGEKRQEYQKILELLRGQ